MFWLLLPLIFCACCPLVQASSPPILWQTWSDERFTQATREHKFVLLNLENAWCHWCHVMDRQTYNDSDVGRLMGESYIGVKVDQSLRPDISNRYYGYDPPVTVICNAAGSEIVRKQGYLSPRQMASLLQAVIDDPSPGPSVTPEPVITYAASPLFLPELLTEVSKKFESQYEVPDQLSAFGVKYLDADSLEYATVFARHGDNLQERRVLGNLQAAQALIDPVWGGAWQSLVVALTSTDANPAARFTRIQIFGRLDSGGDSWNDPNFERPVFIQAQAIRIYAQAYGRWHAPEYLTTAQNVHRYVRSFLTSPKEAFYVGQDADVAEGIGGVAYFALDLAKRRTMGTPQVDKYLYARENGWMIEAFLYAVSGDKAIEQEAELSPRWIVAHRGLRMLISGHSLAREFSRSEISKVSPVDYGHSRYDPYERLLAGKFEDWRLYVDGLVTRPTAFSLADLKRLPSRTHITELNCEEGWSYIAAWTGVQLAWILYLVGASPKAKWVVFYPFYDFWGSIDMPEALHPQTLLAHGMNGEDLNPDHGAPIRLRIPRQLGYKNLKYLARISVVDSLKDIGDGTGSAAPGIGYSWYAGI